MINFNKSLDEEINIIIAILVGEDIFYINENITLQNAISEYVDSIFEIIIEYLSPFARLLCGISSFFDRFFLKDFSLGIDEYKRTIILKDGEQIGMTKLLYKRKGIKK